MSQNRALMVVLAGLSCGTLGSTVAAMTGQERGSDAICACDASGFAPTFVEDKDMVEAQQAR